MLRFRVRHILHTVRGRLISKVNFPFQAIREIIEIDVQVILNVVSLLVVIVAGYCPFGRNLMLKIKPRFPHESVATTNGSM